MTREIRIVPVLNGYICEVECQRIVFQSRNDLVTALNRYYTNPEEVEKEYTANAVNKMRGVPEPTPEGQRIPGGIQREPRTMQVSNSEPAMPSQERVRR